MPHLPLLKKQKQWQSQQFQKPYFISLKIRFKKFKSKIVENVDVFYNVACKVAKGTMQRYHVKQPKQPQIHAFVQGMGIFIYFFEGVLVISLADSTFLPQKCVKLAACLFTKNGHMSLKFNLLPVSITSCLTPVSALTLSFTRKDGLLTLSRFLILLFCLLVPDGLTKVFFLCFLYLMLSRTHLSNAELISVESVENTCGKNVQLI